MNNEVPNWTVTRCGSFEELRRLSIRAWQRRSAAERRQEAWNLVVETWQMQKRDPSELLLRRDIQVIRRCRSRSQQPVTTNVVCKT